MRYLVTVVSVSLVAAACSATGSNTTPPTDSTADTAAIYAAALHALVVDDNSFGGGGNPWSELLLRTSQDSGAGGPEHGEGGELPAWEIRPLSQEERDAIEASLAPLAPIRWIDDPAEWRTDDLMPVIEGSAILGVGPIRFDDDGALVPMSMWCGGLCGLWFTYRVIETDAGWVVTGTEGTIAIS
jgi:hypothetical protein